MASSETSTTAGNITIEGIFTCSDASKEMMSLQTGNLLKGIGLEGDRYAKGIGTYSALQEPGRQLTLISIDGVEDAILKSAETETTSDITLLPSSSSSLSSETKLEPPEASLSTNNTISMRTLRRNVALRGVSSQDLLNSIGSIIRLGSTAKVYVHRNCVPCMYNERKNQCPGMMDVLWGTGGISCEVIETGTINIGDKVTTMICVEDYLKEHTTTTAASIPQCPNNGGKPDEFFVRPKQRSADMVRKLLEGKKKKKEELSTTDKEGLMRLQKSFESVGLTY